MGGSSAGPAVLPSLLGTHRGFRLDVCPHLWFSCTGFPLETLPAHSRCGDGHAASQAPVECGHCWHPPRSAPLPFPQGCPTCHDHQLYPSGRAERGESAYGWWAGLWFTSPTTCLCWTPARWGEHVASGAIPYFNAFFFSFYLRVFLIGSEAKTDDER